MFSRCFSPKCINPDGSDRKRRERAQHLLAPSMVIPYTYNSNISLQFTPTLYASFPNQFHTAQSTSPETIEDFYSCTKVLPSAILSRDGDVDKDDADWLFLSPPQTPLFNVPSNEPNNHRNRILNINYEEDNSDDKTLLPSDEINIHANGPPNIDFTEKNSDDETMKSPKPLIPNDQTIIVLNEVGNPSYTKSEDNIETKLQTLTEHSESRKLYKEELCSPNLISILIYDSDQQSSINLTTLQQDSNFEVVSDINCIKPQINPNSHKFVEKQHACIVEKDLLKFSRDSTGKFIELGRGAYGQVMLGVYKQYSAAIKVFVSPRVTATDIYREAHALHNLQGTGVVPRLFGLLLPSDTEYNLSDRPAIVMERIASSVTFHNLISTAVANDTCEITHYKGPSRTQWLHIAVQLAAAVELLHRRNVLYNDLKMDNVLVQIRENGYRIYLADFGDVSGHKGLLYNVPFQQINGKKKHAYHHLAPEVLMKKTTSFASDVYSLGVALVHLMRVSGTSDKLRRVVRLCLAVDPEDRPSAYIIRLKCADILAKDAKITK